MGNVTQPEAKQVALLAVKNATKPAAKDDAHKNLSKPATKEVQLLAGKNATKPAAKKIVHNNATNHEAKKVALLMDKNTTQLAAKVAGLPATNQTVRKNGTKWWAWSGLLAQKNATNAAAKEGVHQNVTKPMAKEVSLFAHTNETKPALQEVVQSA